MGQLLNEFELKNEDIIDIIACVPTIIDKEELDITQNFSNLKKFYPDYSAVQIKDLIINYPIYLTNFCTDLEKVMTYFKTYAEIEEGQFRGLVEKFPLLLTVEVNLAFKYSKTMF